jgi:hypothetical protein
MLATINGSHRTHALRILGLPLLAAEISVATVSLQPPEIRMWDSGFYGPVEPLWRGLINRGLLAGDIVRAGPRAILEPDLVAAPRLLLAATDAVRLTSAYHHDASDTPNGVPRRKIGRRSPLRIAVHPRFKISSDKHLHYPTM